uniref:Uncharacterized protein n=1 Tax=Plectus sambesii TaxID=2011161 RepID=A0A914V7I9_9BILA
MSSLATSLLFLALAVVAVRAASGDDADAIRDKRRGPWQSQTKQPMHFSGGSRYPSRPWKHQKAPSGANTVYLAQTKSGLRVPWGQRLVRDELSFGGDDSMVGPNARWGSARMTYAWQPTDEDDMIQRAGMRGMIKRLYPPIYEIIRRAPSSINSGAPLVGATDKRSPVFSLRRLQTSVPTATTPPPLQNVMCDPNSDDANSADCYE